METDPLSVTFAALADPTRRAIVERLARGEATVGELAEPFDLSLPAVSKHLKVLQRAGLVEQTKQAQWRSCRLAPEPLREVLAWMEQYKQQLGGRYDRLAAYVQRLQEQRLQEQRLQEQRLQEKGPRP
ncbi:MAG: ArsR/SmtB family transcription factor [Micromonosporaceae bacterium]